MSLRLGYLASGAASSARAIHTAASDGSLDATSAVLIGNNSASGALQWASDAGVPAHHLSGRTHPDFDALDAAVCNILLECNVDLVVLSGYAKRVGPLAIAAFEGRIWNVHPAPLPRFGGEGMFGLGVHQAVLDAGVSSSAVTIHEVNEDYDTGRVLAAFPVSVEANDSPESLRQRVHEAEPACWIELLGRFIRGEALSGLRAL